MKYYKYNNGLYTIAELSEMSGINYSTLVERFKRGYTVEEAMSNAPHVPDSIIEFAYFSHPPDWDGMINSDLYRFYRDWCLKHDYTPETKVHFTRMLKKIVPIRVVPSRVKTYDTISYKRVIRVDNYEPRKL